MKTYKVELDNDEFRIFDAHNDREAQIIAWSIQEELQSDFCELDEYNEEE